MTTPFEDRHDAGRQLGEEMTPLAGDPKVLVLGLPRGGVAVAFEVARALEAPMDVFVVRKLGFPRQPELAMGAIASGGVRVLNESIIRQLGVRERDIEEAAEREGAELRRREDTYRQGKPPQELQGRTAVLVDDGLATGATMLAAVRAARARQAGRIVVAAPVASPDAVATLKREADSVVSLMTPADFHAVGQWYRHFHQVTDEEVCDLLARES